MAALCHSIFCLCECLSVCLSVMMDCGKTADWGRKCLKKLIGMMHGLRCGGMVTENLHGKWDSMINNS
jgi:hypothetical protein